MTPVQKWLAEVALQAMVGQLGKIRKPTCLHGTASQTHRDGLEQLSDFPVIRVWDEAINKTISMMEFPCSDKYWGFPANRLSNSNSGGMRFRRWR